MVNYQQYIPASLLTTQGDIIYENSTPAAARLPIGSAGQLLTVSGSQPAWVSPSSVTWGPADQGLIAWNYDGPAGPSSGSTALATAGTMYVMAVKLAQAASITNIVTVLIANGGTLTSGQCFAALYQGAGGALLGQTADQATAWGSGATKALTMAISGGPVAAAAGTLYVAFWFNGTTGPSFYRTNATAPIFNIGLAATAARWGAANTGITTTAPGTLGTVNAGGIAAYWVGLS
jgi:hypothetical protein